MSSPPKPTKHWYERAGLVLVGGFLKKSQREYLRQLAKADDKSLSRYVTRLLERHIEEQKAKDKPKPSL